MKKFLNSVDTVLTESLDGALERLRANGERFSVYSLRYY